MTTRIVYSSGLWLSFLQKTDEELKKSCRMDIFKATGRGGQKKNKTSNAIRLTLEHVVVTFTTSRSRAENIAGAIKKLRIAIAMDIVDGFENRSSSRIYPDILGQYYQKGTIKINVKNPLFPIVIGMLIDLFINYQGSYKSVSGALKISNSQLRKFISKNVIMIETINKIIDKCSS